MFLYNSFSHTLICVAELFYITKPLCVLCSHVLSLVLARALASLVLVLSFSPSFRSTHSFNLLSSFIVFYTDYLHPLSTKIIRGVFTYTLA